MSSPSENIRLARARTGMDPEEVARSAGLNKPTYIFHVEADDDEVRGNISLRALKSIARTLGTTPLELLEGTGAVGPSSQRSSASLAAFLKARIAAANLSVEVYSDRIGWDVKPILGDPECLWDYPFEMLQALCSELGLDWREVIDG